MKPDKSILLFAISILLITLFFLLPQNNDWERHTVLGYWMDFQKQKNKTEPERRKVLRYGNAYTYSRVIASYFKQKNNLDKPLVLLPSEEYFKKQGIIYPVPEPAVFYYYTGLKTTWANSPLAEAATWYVHVVGNNIRVDSIRDAKTLREAISLFKQYPYPL